LRRKGKRFEHGGRESLAQTVEKRGPQKNIIRGKGRGKREKIVQINNRNGGKKKKGTETRLREHGDDHSKDQFALNIRNIHARIRENGRRW